MHSSVLQNKKYIKFADANTVEVMALSSLERGIEAGDRKAATYKAKNEQGEEVEYMIEFPGLTVDDMQSLRGSPARKYNQSGKIPYTALVDPHTLEQGRHWVGGQSAGAIMDAVKDMRKKLDKEHGKALNRKDLVALKKGGQEVFAFVDDGDFSKAMSTLKALDKKYGSIQNETLMGRMSAVRAHVMEAAAEVVNSLEKEANFGNQKKAKSKLKKLARAFKGTELGDRTNEILASLEAE